MPQSYKDTAPQVRRQTSDNVPPVPTLPASPDHASLWDFDSTPWPSSGPCTPAYNSPSVTLPGERPRQDSHSYFPILDSSYVAHLQLQLMEEALKRREDEMGEREHKIREHKIREHKLRLQAETLQRQEVEMRNHEGAV